MINGRCACACQSSRVPDVSRQGWWLLVTLVFSVKQGWAGALSLTAKLSQSARPFPLELCMYSLLQLAGGKTYIKTTSSRCQRRFWKG